MSAQLDGEIAIVIDGQTLVGWQSVRISRGIEHFPSDFELCTTEKYPGSNTELAIYPGKECTITVGGEPIITGYVDEYDPTITAHSHTVRISGRSKCQDLADCSAYFGNLTMQMLSATALEIITEVCNQYGIDVTDNTEGRATAANFPFALNRGESPLEIIDRLARWNGFIYHDLPDGNLMLSLAGEGNMSSGLVMGGDYANVQVGNYRWNVANVMSDYYAWFQADDQRRALTGSLPVRHVTDNYMQSIGRKRVLYLLCEQTLNEDNYALQRAQWEANHREGTGQTITATVDRWRDSSGQLWSPNYTIDVNMPQLKIFEVVGGWVVSQVTFSKEDDTGQTAELVLNPKYTFDPQPDQQTGGTLAALSDTQNQGTPNSSNQTGNPNTLGQSGSGGNATSSDGGTTTETLGDGTTVVKDSDGNILT